MPLKLIYPPKNSPIELGRIKANARIDNDFKEHDDLLNMLQDATVRIFERNSGRQLCEAVWEYISSGFKDLYEISPCPVVEVQSIKYYDVDNKLQDLSNSDYAIDIVSEPARIVIKNSPLTYDRPDAVLIRFRAGYEYVPEDILVGIMVYVCQRYETPTNNVETLPTFFTSLINSYKVWNRR